MPVGSVGSAVEATLYLSPDGRGLRHACNPLLFRRAGYHTLDEMRFLSKVSSPACLTARLWASAGWVLDAIPRSFGSFLLTKRRKLTSDYHNGYRKEPDMRTAPPLAAPAGDNGDACRWLPFRAGNGPISCTKNPVRLGRYTDTALLGFSDRLLVPAPSPYAYQKGRLVSSGHVGARPAGALAAVAVGFIRARVGAPGRPTNLLVFHKVHPRPVWARCQHNSCRVRCQRRGYGGSPSPPMSDQGPAPASIRCSSNPPPTGRARIETSIEC
jgi:hypothetical protein